MRILKFAVGMLVWIGAIGRADMPSVHGMVLFGDKVMYASHLPMFHQPHDYQVILELHLSENTRVSTLDKYAKLKAEGDKLFTLVPQPMDLTKVMSGEQTTFSGTIYRGHFERGGIPLGMVRVDVSSVIYGAKLDPDAGQINDEEYLLFGQDGEYFAAHVINQFPSYDLIASTTQPQKNHFTFCRTRNCEVELAHSTPVKDEVLPIVVKPFLVEEIWPTVNTVFGTPFSGISAVIKDVIYADDADLSH